MKLELLIFLSIYTKMKPDRFSPQLEGKNRIN